MSSGAGKKGEIPETNRIKHV